MPRAIIGTSIGIAIAPYDGVEADELTRAADMALYAAKESRGGTFCFFTTGLRDAASKTAELGDRLRDAVDRGELRLYKRMPARDLWRKMLTMLFETGHPWITWKDPSNIRSPQDHVGVVHSSNLCTEILLNTSPSETAASVPCYPPTSRARRSWQSPRDQLSASIRPGRQEGHPDLGRAAYPGDAGREPPD